MDLFESRLFILLAYDIYCLLYNILSYFNHILLFYTGSDVGFKIILYDSTFARKLITRKTFHIEYMLYKVFFAITEPTVNVIFYRYHF